MLSERERDTHKDTYSHVTSKYKYNDYTQKNGHKIRKTAQSNLAIKSTKIILL